MAGFLEVVKSIGLNPIRLENGMTLDTTLLLKAMFDEIIRRISAGETVVIKNFGTFKGKAIKGRRIETSCIPGGVTEFPDMLTLKFKASPNVKHILNPTAESEEKRLEKVAKATKDVDDAKATKKVGKKTKKKVGKADKKAGKAEKVGKKVKKAKEVIDDVENTQEG